MSDPQTLVSSDGQWWWDGHQWLPTRRRQLADSRDYPTPWSAVLADSRDYQAVSALFGEALGPSPLL